MKWYKHDPAAFLEGVIGLDAEERGFYITVIDLLCARDGQEVTDELVCKAVACNPRSWRAVKNRLVEKGKIWSLADGSLMAKRVENVLNEARTHTERQANRARNRWEKDSASNEINGLRIPLANMPTTTTTTTTKDIDSPRKRGPRPKTAFPEGWVAEGLTDHTRPEFERFRRSALASDRRYANWQMAWENWLSSPYCKLPPEPEPSSATVLPIKGFHARDGSPEMAAWDEYWQQTRGVSAPRSRRIDGYIFSTQWPPGHPNGRDETVRPPGPGQEERPASDPARKVEAGALSELLGATVRAAIPFPARAHKSG